MAAAGSHSKHVVSADSGAPSMRFHAMHTRRLQTRDDSAVVSQCSSGGGAIAGKGGLRKATISKMGILNINDVPGQTAAGKLMCDSVSGMREHRRARAKCLEWLDSLDSDDTEVNPTG